MRQFPLGVICVLVVIITLSLGLWPFHVPENEVNWLPEAHGLHFGNHATVISSGAFQREAPPPEPPCSVEIWLQPTHSRNSSTILAFYRGQKHLGLSLHQSISDLSIEVGDSDLPYPARTLHMYVDDIFSQRRAVFVTVTSGARGTSAYVDGALARTAAQHPLSATACTGRLILGDSALQSDTWSGQVNGLAIYSSELPATTVLAHYKAWTEHRQPDVIPGQHCVGLYRFEEGAGSVVHNRAGSGLELTIPPSYNVLDQIFLEPFWEEFNMSWGYWKNAIKNVIGFVPLGFCFYGYFLGTRNTSRPALVAVIVGTVVSLTIEVLQGFLPTRQSGTTDIITNSLGTYLGVVSCRPVGPILAKIIPWIPWFLPESVVAPKNRG